VATQEQARDFALRLPEAAPGSHHGRADLRVRNKIFATLPPDGSLVLKTTPGNLDALLAAGGGAFRKVWGERWVGVDVSRLELEELEDLIVDAWRLAAPKSLVRTFDHERGG